MTQKLSKDAQAMLRWLETKLNEKLNERHTERLKVVTRRAIAQEELTPLKQALLNFKHGNVEPLRRYLVALTGEPEIAGAVTLPKLKRGQNWRRAKKQPVQPPEIAEWAKIIREIWKEHGVKRRAETAEEFAFALFMMDAEVKDFDPHSGDEWVRRASDQNKRGK
jgi:hypothetical protein